MTTTDQTPYIAAALILLTCIYYWWSRPRELSITQEFARRARENGKGRKGLK